MYAKRWTPHASIALLAFWYLLTLVYAWLTGADFVSRDQWHFVPMLDHYMSGTLDWHELWESHSEHVKPGYKLLFLLNARYLGLDIQAEVMVGMLLLGLMTILLIRDMRRSATTEPMPWLACLSAGLVMMSFNQWASYSYSLLTLGGFGGTLLQLALFIGFARLLQRGLSAWQMGLLTLVLFLAVFGFSGARGPAVVGACVLAAIAACLVDAPARRRILLAGVPFLLLCAASIAVYLKLLHFQSGRHVVLADELRASLADPLGTLAYVSGTLAESMLDLVQTRGISDSDAAVMGLAVVGYAILGWSLWRYFKAGLWRRSWVPLMLIAYSALFVLEVLIGRYGSEVQTQHGYEVPRYVFDSHMWLVGCAWILGLDWAQAGAKVRIRQAAVGVLLAMVVLEVVNLKSVQSYARYQIKAKAQAEIDLRAIAAGREGAEALPRWSCPNDKLCSRGIATLKQYHLDFARDTGSP
ncbi:MAG TPA: hypothetical protein VH327_02210 [Gammaproteobacteria bacterium]|nr:hypothetical protein [Gammaproteobacteria bacterium]